jgi:hypothetical protein
VGGGLPGDVLRDDALADVRAGVRVAADRRLRLADDRAGLVAAGELGAFGSSDLYETKPRPGRACSPPTIPVGSTREAARFSACATRARCSSIAWPSVTIRNSSGTDGPPVTAAPGRGRR